MIHDDVEELLGAYALDAVDGDEARLVEEHLRECPRCRAELAAHREVTAVLGNFAAKAPDRVWQAIASEIEAEPSVVPVNRTNPPFLDDIQAARSRAERRRPRLAALLAAVAAALAIAVGVLSARVADLNGNVHTVTSAVNKSATANAAASALLDPDARIVQLTSASGPVAKIVLLPKGQAYWGTIDLKSLAANRTYQLWAIVNGEKRAVSLGLLGAAPVWVSIRIDAQDTRLMVTAEPIGGSAQPTTPVLAQGVLGTL